MVIAVSVAALLLTAAGCGGDSENTAGDSTAAIETTDTSSTDTGGGTDTGSSTDTTDDRRSRVARRLHGADRTVREVRQALGAATSGSGAPDLQETAKAYEEFADEVPEEIRDAFQTVAAAFTTYAKVLEDVDLGSGETPDPETLAKLAESSDGAQRHRAHGGERGDRRLGDQELHRGRVAPSRRLVACAPDCSVSPSGSRLRTPRSSRLRFPRSSGASTSGSRRLPGSSPPSTSCSRSSLYRPLL